MIVELQRLVADISPQRTVIFLGAGAAMPSHGPSAAELVTLIGQSFSIPVDGLSLADAATLAEKRRGGRKDLIEVLRNRISKLVPTGGLLNLPSYEWRSIFTTNYDTLVEAAYKRQRTPLNVVSSNFDFSESGTNGAANLFKLHGTIEKDTCDGYQVPMILTIGDYDQTADYREHLYDRLKADLAGAHLLVIGHSMQDPDITEVIQRAVRIRATSGGALKLTMLIYERDDNRAELMAARGFDVCFGGIDEFFEAMSSKLSYSRQVYSTPETPLEKHRELLPVTIDVAHACTGNSRISAMFNGSPATYADIHEGLTFPRSIVQELVREFKADRQFAILLGASGIGKTTAARQCGTKLLLDGFSCWEHQTDYHLQVSSWLALARQQEDAQKDSLLIIDDAHHHLHQLNDLADALFAQNIKRFRILAISTRRLWWSRIKSLVFIKPGVSLNVRSLDPREIDALLNLVDTHPQWGALIEDPFRGFSLIERRRRLQVHCESDTFVCLKSIFASEKFDDIILREFAELPQDSQDIYRLISAMESTGIQAHRQMIMRLLGIDAANIPSVLKNLEDIIREVTINEREGIYAWRGRHAVIADIVTRYKFSDENELKALFHRVVDNIQPTYDIEIRTLREICDPSVGIGRIADKTEQNVLLRKIMSVAPGERVPRHRLIYNLIKMGSYDQADTEIRIFCKDFKQDGVVARYKIQLQIARATRSEGILKEDREAILKEAAEFAITMIERFPQAVKLVSSYCEVGVEYFRITGDLSVLDAAVEEAKAAEARTGDPEIARMITRYLRAVEPVYSV